VDHEVTAQARSSTNETKKPAFDTGWSLDGTLAELFFKYALPEGKYDGGVG